MVWPTTMRFDWFFCNEFEAHLHEELQDLSVPKTSSASDFAQRMHGWGGKCSLPKTICLRFCTKELEDFALPKNHMCFNLDLYRCIPSASKPGSLFWQTDTSHVDILGWTIWTKKKPPKKRSSKKNWWAYMHTCIDTYIHTIVAWNLSLNSITCFTFSGFFFSNLNIFQRLEEIPDKYLIPANLPTFHHPLYFHVFPKFLQSLDR